MMRMDGGAAHLVRFSSVPGFSTKAVIPTATSYAQENGGSVRFRTDEPVPICVVRS